jgi:diaminohydroxyphosphoribosylaminopyrimidine deaminase/5-amino-6-(5-phosphoribosylamino)uracil reductase
MTTASPSVETLAAEGLPAAAIARGFQLALERAAAFAGATAPNPPVGCVALDRAGAVIACEAHQMAGGAHAEAAVIEACRRAGVLEQIHTLIVTLEPCNHTGRTPPCTEAILRTPAKSVWIGVSDPNPQVAGGGAARLGSAGLAVGMIDHLPHPAASDLARAARRLIGPFATRVRTGRPWVTLKQAIAADGGMTPPAGKKTFTSPASLDLAHQMRRRVDAIITGSGCVLADDPAFTVRRVADHPGKRRKLAILDRRGRTPETYLEAARARGFEVWVRSDLPGLLDELGAAGVQEALVEAGPTLLDAFLTGGFWHEHFIIRQSPTPGLPDAGEVRQRAPI